MTLQSALLIILPVFTPLVGTSVAAILAQSRWPAWANDLIAWIVLLSIAALDLWANGQLAGQWTILADCVQVLALLSSGWLVKLDPWLAWLDWLQSNVFNLVPIFEDALHIGPTSTQTVTTQAYTPQKPIVFSPEASGTVPPRTSGQDPTKQA